MSSSVFFYDQYVEQDDPISEIIDGLTADRKFLSPKFFYDERGSELFTEITRQPEYYLTRTEIELLKSHTDEISELIGDDFMLIEYGSGSSEKIRILLESLRPSIYAPLDISRDYLAQAAKALGQEYPWLEVHATCVDFTEDFVLPFKADQRRVSFFPGSSIGNFGREEAAEFLTRIRNLVGDSGGLLLGVDLKKEPHILNAAYNDANGITAAFNLNVLSHLNDLYGANFEISEFSHQAFYNESKGAIEMHLDSQREQSVNLGGIDIHFAEGESIHTEYSYKYSIDEVKKMALGAGFTKVKTWQDDGARFGVFYLYSA